MSGWPILRAKKSFLEAQRISERTNFDVEMIRETGVCSGIENYTRHLNFAQPGEPPLHLNGLLSGGLSDYRGREPYQSAPDSWDV